MAPKINKRIQTAHKALEEKRLASAATGIFILLY
jgi:hypothetical protein